MDTFNDIRRSDPQLRRLIHKVSVRRDANMTRSYPQASPCRVQVALHDGAVLAQEVRYPRGHAGNAMSDEEVRDKFVRMTSPRLAVPERARLYEAIWNLEQVENLTELFDLMAQ
jgi:2-methylcitrate dehydratase